MPPPTSSSGRSALAMSAAARSSSARSGRVRRACAFSVASSTQKSAASKSCSPWQTSSGTSSTTGPGRPEVATAKARRTSSGMRLVASTRISSFTAGRRISTWPRLLRHVLPGVIAVGVADDRDMRHAGVERLDQRGDQIGRARSERRVAHAGTIGDARIGVRGEGAAALVVDQVVAQAERAHRLVERQQLEAAHAEHRTDARQLQHLGERLPAVQRADGRFAVTAAHRVPLTRRRGAGAPRVRGCRCHRGAEQRGAARSRRLTMPSR